MNVLEDSNNDNTVGQDKGHVEEIERPVRTRLRQKTGAAIREEARKNLLTVLKEKDDSKRDVEVRIVPGRQRSVNSTRAFSRKEFVLEYAGVLVTGKRAEILEKEYSTDSSKGSFQYYFRFR